MRIYLDTSVLVAMLIREACTEAAKAFLSACQDRPLLISRWTVTELSSALALKVRRGSINDAEQAAALAMLKRLGGARLHVSDIDARDYDNAASFCDRASLPVRAGDALHLAVCRRAGARLVTFDTGMASAATGHGIPCELLRATSDRKGSA